MKRLALFLVLMLTIFTSTLYGQQDTVTQDTLKFWKFAGIVSLNFSQTQFSDNWQAGGESSIAGLGLLNVKAKYKKNKTSWENILDMKYGLTQQKDKSPRKNDDNLEITSNYGYKAFEHWDYSANLDFRTQMAKGYKDGDPDSAVISKFLAPAYIQLALGMVYEPSDHYSLILSPVTGKITLVNDNELSKAGRFGVKPGEKARFEFGASLTTTVSKEILKNVTLNSKLGLFYNYLDSPQLDVNWNILINMKINKFLAANIISQLIYDKDQIDQVQFKEIIGLGLTYTF